MNATSPPPDAEERREFRIAVRLTAAEHAHLIFDSVLAEESPGELLRLSYFDGRVPPHADHT